jgi:DHA1 family tetracycline resistance protein-like MFS transporter
MGLIGMAFGLGFVLGPLLGGVLLSWPLPEDWRLRLPFLVAAGFSTVAWVLVLTRLPEPRSRAAPARVAARVVSWQGIVTTLTLSDVGRLILIGFLAVFAFAAFEGTFALYLRRRMQWDARTAAFAFAGIGLASAMVQGGLIRRLVPRYGEVRLILAGLALACCGLAGLAAAPHTPGLVASMMFLGVGQGLVSPSVSGLLSRRTPVSEQGAVFGTLTSAQTLARMLSYSIANVLLGKWTAAPYWGACGVDLLAFLVAGSIASGIHLGAIHAPADAAVESSHKTRV